MQKREKKNQLRNQSLQMGQGRGKCTSPDLMQKLQARSNKTASSPKGNAGLEISPDDFWAPSPRGVHDARKIPPWHTGTFCRLLRWWWSKSRAQWNILEKAWPGRGGWCWDEKSQSERGRGGSVNVSLGPWRRGSGEFPPGQQVLSGSWSRLGGVL